MNVCTKCGKPAVSERQCEQCGGKGQVMPMGVYRPMPCRECRWSGKLTYCEEHKGVQA